VSAVKWPALEAVHSSAFETAPPTSIFLEDMTIKHSYTATLNFTPFHIREELENGLSFSFVSSSL
jgi:hypothetical protein